MFRRKWCGLPADPEFPCDLKGLGYFINDDDQIVSIEDPKYLFNYFLSRNDRVNECQRFSMNSAIEQEVHSRLTSLGLTKVKLPLEPTNLSSPHTPIFVSQNLRDSSRVIVIVGESCQDLGVLAHRVLGGQGGVNKGSMVSIVKAIQALHSSAIDYSPPGIVITNPGQLIWWAKGQRALSRMGFRGAPRPSAVHQEMLLDERTQIPRNHSPLEHVKYIFEKVISNFANVAAKIDVVGLGDGADTVEQYFGNDEIWKSWEARISGMALVAGFYPIWQIESEGFKKFLRERTRAFSASLEPLGMILSGPEGNLKTTTFTQLGCPIYSAGEKHLSECCFINAYPLVFEFLQQVAMSPGYKNEEVMEVKYADLGHNVNSVYDWGDENVPFETPAPVQVTIDKSTQPEANTTEALELE